MMYMGDEMFPHTLWGTRQYVSMYTLCDLELECVFASDLCATFACTLCLGEYADKSGNTQGLRKEKGSPYVC